jgi:hypothetical protein
MVVLSIDQGDVYRRRGERFRRHQPAEPGTNDDHVFTGGYGHRIRGPFLCT